MLPTAEITVMDGRDVQLGDLRSSIFRAGANATIVGDYLTAYGARPADVVAMVTAQGLTLDVWDTTDKTVGT